MWLVIRSVVLATVILLAAGAAAASAARPPNIVYFLVDNLGQGEIGAYGGARLRGTATPRIDQLAAGGLLLENFAPESQCTPSRSALMTGRYAIRSGNQKVMLSGSGPGGLVAWERTMADQLAAAGYDNYILGKWHIGETRGRLPTDHGFLSWYGTLRSWGESLWTEDPYYNPERDPVPYMVESEAGGDVKKIEVLTVDVKRNADAEFLRRARKQMTAGVAAGRPFFIYFNHTLMHLPVIPRDEFKGVTGYGNMADAVAQLDSDVGTMLDMLQELGVADNTIFIFSGDNGPEDDIEARGDAGHFLGSYFAGYEGNLRTPAIIYYPGKVAPGRVSNEIVHITDMFPTLLQWAGAEVPTDRIIDGKDQRAFFEGKTDSSAREGFIFWNGDELYGAKWHHYKIKLWDQKYMWDPVQKLATPWVINLVNDPKERTPYNPRYQWVGKHIGGMLVEFQQSLKREPLIPTGAPLDYVPVPRRIK